jgi:hypothetical protein
VPGPNVSCWHFCEIPRQVNDGRFRTGKLAHTAPAGAQDHPAPGRYVMLLWLGMGSMSQERFPDVDACFKRMEVVRRYYDGKYVIRSIGCFPKDLIFEASKGG